MKRQDAPGLLEEYANRTRPPESSWSTTPYNVRRYVEQGDGAVLMRASDGLYPKEYQGMSLEVVPDARGGSGLGWSSGRLRLEHHPKLKVYGRGTNAANSEYWKMRLLPPVVELITTVVNTLKPAPWRLEEPVLPDWAKGIEEAQQLQRRLWAWSRYAWGQWTMQGRAYGLTELVEQMISGAMGFGYYLGEGSTVAKDVNGLGAFACPQLPLNRMPWSITEWVIDGEKPLGAVQQSLDIDSYGRTGGGDGNTRTVIPLDQCLHVRWRPASHDDTEGMPVHRPAYSLLLALLKAYQAQGMSIETDSLGTWIVEQSIERPFTPDSGSGSKTIVGEITRLKNHFTNYIFEHMPYLLLPPGGKARKERSADTLADLTPQVRLLEQQALSAMGGGDKTIARYGAGSRAAKETASDNERDQLDYAASLVADGLAQYLQKAAAWQFPEAEKYGIYCPVAYGQVEQQDNGAYVLLLKDYLEIRNHPQMSQAQREKMDKQLDFIAGKTSEGEDAEGGDDTAASPTQEKEASDQPPQDDQPDSAQLAAQESFKPPKGVQEAAQRGLDLRREFGRGGTEVGIARARDLSNGRRISAETIKEMVGWFARHEDNRSTYEGDQTSNGYIAWMLWGGDAGRTWAQSIADRIDA